MRVALTLKSRNAKTGPIPVSTSSATTCPTSCPLKGAGCYAQSGPLGIFWRKVTDGAPGFGGDWSTFLDGVEHLAPESLWRHNQAGDLPGDGDLIDLAALADLVRANAGKRGFTYTHKPVAGSDALSLANRAAVAFANASGFTVNLSADNLAEADALADLGAGPVVTVLPSDASANVMTPKGRTVVVCPATQREGVSCATCQLCQRQRSTIVGFPAHGASKRKADAIAKGLTQ